MTGSPADREVVGVVLAAGSSSRMGTAKALLDADGRSFLERAIRSLSGGGCPRTLVVVERIPSPVAAMALRSGGSVVENPGGAGGVAGSLGRALGALGEGVGAVVLHPVDHPLVQSETIARLVSSFRHGGAEATVPLHRGRRGLPLIATVELLRSVWSAQAMVGDGDLEELRDAIGARAEEVEVEDRGVITDLNTIAEYRRQFPASFRRRFQSR